MRADSLLVRLGAGFLLTIAPLGLIHGQAPAAPATPAPAAEPAAEDTSLEGIYKSAMEKFNGGDFAGAAEQLTQLLASLPEDATKQREPLMFTLGAAHFNAKNYPTAIATFTEFLQKFPQAEQANEVTYALGQAQLLSGQAAAGNATLARLENVPGMREQVLIFQAGSAKSAGNTDAAIAALEKLTAAGITSPTTAKGGVQLVNLYLEKSQLDKAAGLLVKLQGASDFVENIVLLDALTLQLGDNLLKAGKAKEALECFRRVRLKEDIIALQKQRIEKMEERIERNLADNRTNPKNALKNLAANAQIKTDIESAQKQLAEFEKLPPMVGPLYLRMAQAFQNEEKLWEALVVFEELLKRVPEGAAEREPAAFATVIGFNQAEQSKLAMAAAERYLKEFPTGPNAGTVGYLRGAIALQEQDFEQANGWLSALLEQAIQPDLKEQIRMMLGHANFSQGKFDEAIQHYKRYVADHPQGAGVEEAEYRSAIALMFGGKFEEAVPALEAYLKKYPEGLYAPDAKYRLAVCWYSAQQYADVIERCRKWLEEYPSDPQGGEVNSLLGDALAATNKENEAIEAYKRSVEYAQGAGNDQVLNYSLFEASKLLQRNARWAEVASLMEEFVQENPDHPTALAALYWIGKAKAREGKPEEATAFLAETAKKHIDNPTREPIEQILGQIAQIVSKMRPPRPATPPPAADGTTPAPAPKPAPIDHEAELQKVLAFAKESPTARARALYAQSELARMTKKPEKQQELLGEIADKSKPADLSPLLLGLSGDYWLRQKNYDKAEPFYRYLYENYPKSNFIDYAYAGLGEVALGRGDARKALQFFTDGTEKIVANTKLRELTLGEGKARFALGGPDQLERARQIFEQVASTREWRGEATAEAIYYMGEVQFAQQKWAEANAYYQRVFVTYRKFLEWVAKSYLRSAESFVKLGQNPEAIRTYQELLRNEKLADLPEGRIARQRLQELGQP